jgi:hypothetical protein
MSNAEQDLRNIYAELRGLLHKAVGKRNVVIDTDAHYYVNEREPDAKGKPLFCCSVKIGSGKVQLHLMPIYSNPEWLSGVSDALKKRMQGKSCFNFAKHDAVLFNELGALIRRCLS